jgi:hypothetical protein
MSMLNAFAFLCAIGMVGRDDDQPTKRLTDAEMLRIKAALQFQEQGQVLGQVKFQLVIEDFRQKAEQQVQETRRARIAEARLRSAVETLSGSIIGDSFRSSRRRAGLP